MTQSEWKLLCKSNGKSIYVTEEVVAKIFEDESDFLKEVYYHCYLSSISSKYTVKILKVDAPNQVLYMKRETMDFHDFFNSNPQNKKTIRNYFYQMCKCVEFLHKQNVAHLDLKMENFLRLIKI